MRPRAPGLPAGWFSPIDVAEYRYLVRELPDKATMVEVGVFLGRSLSSVADLIRAKQIRLVAVDTFTKLGMRGYRPLKDTQRNLFDKHMHERGLDPIVYAMPSMEAAIRFQGKADFVFLDADHTYRAVLAEIAAWRLKTTRMMGGHDYRRKATSLVNGVKQAVDESFRSVHIRGEVWSAEM